MWEQTLATSSQDAWYRPKAGSRNGIYFLAYLLKNAGWQPLGFDLLT